MALPTPERTILVVDDEESIRTVLTIILQRSGFQIIQAADGTTALATLQLIQVDLILLDITLPDITGMLLLELIRGQKTLEHVPVVFLSGDWNAPMKVRAFEKGAVDYITKPFDSGELIARIRSHLAYRDEMLARRLAITLQAEAAQRSLRIAEERLSALVRNSFDLICELDGALRIVYASPNHADILCFDSVDLLETPLNQWIHPEDQVATTTALQRTLDEGCSVRTLARFQDQGGRWRWLDISGSVLDTPQTPRRILLVSRDITQAKETESTLEHLALHDPLTQLGNRQLLGRELVARLEFPVEAGALWGAVIFLDLDNFKLINDTKGHLAGDRVLQLVASVLRGVFSKDALICRVGGDEFCVLLRDVTADDALAQCELLLAELEKEVLHAEFRELTVTMSAGIALIEPGIRTEELLSRADSALYASKAGGKNKCRLYLSDNEELVQIRNSVGWYQRIQDGLSSASFEVYYQPVQSVRTQDTLCYEALARYRDAEGVIHPPGAFLPAAERYNLMPRLDRYMIRRVLGDLAKRDDITAAINLSGQSVNDPGMRDFILRCFEESGTDPRRVIFEITETVFITNLGAAQDLVDALKGSGCAFALDDFGSGFSSLNYLRNLPVDLIKIDGSFVACICGDPVGLALLRGINEIAHMLGKFTVAEYVDSEEKLTMLKGIGVDYAQGFHLGIPAPLNLIPSNSRQATLESVLGSADRLPAA